MTDQQPYEPDFTPAASAPLTVPRPMYWSIRREMWENRSIYLAPLIVAAVVLFATFISVIGIPRRLRVAEPAKQHSILTKPFDMAPAPIMLASFLVGMFYSLDALYGERRDRSILFWKSLPVSDRTAVLAKASIPLVVLPAIAYALSVFTQLTLLMVSTPIMLAQGVSPGRVWSAVNFVPGLVIMFYGLAVHTLWFAPIYGWFMLVSAWAKRAPFLWAIMPLLAVSAVERIVFGTWTFMYMLQYRLMGAMREAFIWKKHVGDVSELSQLNPVRFLGAPGLWVGLMLAAAFIALAIRQRRAREPI